MADAVLVDANDRPEEMWQDPARGSIRWKTLISGDATPSDTLVCGIAIMAKGDHFAQHRHAEPELYFGLEGEVDVMVNGHLHRLKPGVALFIPGDALHGVPQAEQPVRWLYTFAKDAFPDIAYHFAPLVASTVVQDGQGE